MVAVQLTRVAMAAEFVILLVIFGALALAAIEWVCESRREAEKDQPAGSTRLP